MNGHDERMRSITIASGKGGVGKTSVTLNLGLALAQMKKRVVVIDGDLAMANLGILMGIEHAPITLHNVLVGEVDVKDAVYEGPMGLKYIPAGLSLDKLRKIDFTRLKEAVDGLADSADFVLVDSPSGLGTDGENALRASKEVLLIVTPEPSSLADCLKVKAQAARADINAVGVVYNMVTGVPEEIKSKDVATVLETPVLVEIPFDSAVRRASASQEPVLIKFPNSPFSRGIRQVAAKISGESAPDSGAGIKKGWWQSILDGLARMLGRS